MKKNGKFSHKSQLGLGILSQVIKTWTIVCTPAKKLPTPRMILQGVLIEKLSNVNGYRTETLHFLPYGDKAKMFSTGDMIFNYRKFVYNFQLFVNNC